jgi:hypothetical protein
LETKVKLRFGKAVPAFTEPQHISDKVAMNAIATAMSGVEWNADLWEVVADIVQLTGRELKDSEDGDLPDRRDNKMFQDLADHGLDYVLNHVDEY